MTVKVYIWKGTNPDLTVYNVLGNVGHVSMQISDESESKDIYISHRPPESPNPPSQSPNPPRRDSKDLLKYAIEAPAERNKNITSEGKKLTFEEERDEIRKRKPDATIEIKGLDETQMRAFYKDYDENKLEISKYHIKSSNCSTAVATFLKAGLKCPRDKICPFCAPTENVGKHRARRGLRIILVLGSGSFLIRYCVSDKRMDNEIKLRAERADYYREQFRKPVEPNTGYRRIELPPSNQIDGWTPLFIVLAIGATVLYAINIFFDIELLGAGWAKMKFWSPQTVEIFANKLREHASQNPKKLCKRKRFIFF